MRNGIKIKTLDLNPRSFSEHAKDQSLEGILLFCLLHEGYSNHLSSSSSLKTMTVFSNLGDLVEEVTSHPSLVLQ